jgi:TolB protein
VNELGAAWSPDGTKLVFDHPRDGDTEIYVQSVTGIRRLTDNERSDLFPSWSPDGRHIAFLSDRDGDGTHVYVMNSDGSNEERLSTDDAGALRPTWMHDSRHVGYTALDCGGGYCTGTIKIVAVESHDATTIERGKFVDMRQPSFAGDGRIGFAGADEFNDEGIFVADPDGRHRRTVGGGIGGGSDPVWAPDATRIAYDCGYGICVVRLGRRSERLLRTTGA